MMNTSAGFRKLVGMGIGVTVVWGCTTPQLQTVTIFEDSHRSVTLQAMPDAHKGKEYDHPATITEADMADLLRGLHVEQGSFAAWGSGKSHRVFTDEETAFFTPLFVQGLRQATPEQMVTFFQTTQPSREYEATTSGGIFVKGDALHIVLSNHRVKTRIWRDVEQYQASYRHRPLERIESQPGRLFHKSRETIDSTNNGEFGSFWTRKPWHIAIRLASEAKSDHQPSPSK